MLRTLLLSLVVWVGAFFPALGEPRAAEPFKIC